MTSKTLPELAEGASGARTMDPAIAEGIRLFNLRKFFEAHETLEGVWLKARGDEKTLLHGLIQVAAAFHHHTRQNPEGFRSLLEKGLKKLERFDVTEEGIDLESLCRQLHPWKDFLNSGLAVREPPSLPHIKLYRPVEK